ncbi:MAG: GNAT family N-acetyltransferase [Pseudomonadota bacterium]|jgi:predicted GNAT family N-acyltransferase|uniref:N-acetyltransferase domain-containing protein n=1 Tax=hydrothermal vent metagenome TaxID=652676 RepID=A0A170PQB4_9ZZZZ
MRAELQTPHRDSFGRLRFSEKVEHTLARASSPPVSRIATDAEIVSVLDEASRLFPVASLSAVQRMRERNAGVVRMIEGLGTRNESAMLAYLPLSAEGAKLLIEGRFDGKNPKAEWIVAEDEIPTAIYIWMAWTPGTLARSLPAMAQIFSSLTPDGCPLFSRASTEHSMRIHTTMGFQQASQIYPGAPDWLLVVLPEGEMVPARKEMTVRPPAPKIEVRPVRSFEDMAMIFAVRSSTYISEQFCLYSEEFDGNDFCATHLIGFIDGDPAGCIRMRYFGDFVKVERLAVRREYRRSRLAFKLVREALALARVKGFKRFYGHARLDLVPFWAMFGFREMAERPLFKFADVEYREMELDGEASENPIGIGDDPMVTIRPEGAWNVPGPLELSNLRPSRAAFFSDMKTVSRAAH